MWWHFTIGSAIKSTDRATTRDYDGRNIPDLLVLSATLTAVMGYHEGLSSLLAPYIRNSMRSDPVDLCRGHIGRRGAMATALAFAAFTVFVMKVFTYTGFRVNHAHVYRRQCSRITYTP